MKKKRDEKAFNWEGSSRKKQKNQNHYFRLFYSNLRSQANVINERNNQFWAFSRLIYDKNGCLISNRTSPFAEGKSNECG